MEEAFEHWLEKNGHFFNSQIFDPDEIDNYIARQAFKAGYKAARTEKQND